MPYSAASEQDNNPLVQAVAIPLTGASTASVPEFPTLIILPLFAVGVLLTIGLFRKARK